ncbi:MAG: NmrA family transcriptional regulator [Candidatus Melainabacteria bacterium HGW-Melainabacteria-1]|nr:MAG: NmrA family transcriptional regulator [Candidatus Melainabacteria bacterium HGW-Melainabacteria-1]
MKNTLKIAIFGATGHVGSQLVNLALAQGHTVTAFMRTPAKLAQAGVQVGHGRLRVLRGDVRDAEQIAGAVSGQDAVISAIGRSQGAQADLLGLLAQNLLTAMQTHDVSRLISLAGVGVLTKSDQLDVGAQFKRYLLQLLNAQQMADAQRHAALLQASELCWTLVRPSRLTDQPPSGSYRCGSLKLGLNAQIARADLADFMLKLATQGGFEREAPMLSY